MKTKKEYASAGKDLLRKCSFWFHNPGVIGLVLSIVFPVFLIFFVLFFPAPPPLISIEVDSEYISYRVARPEIASIIINQAEYRAQNWQCELSAKGTLPAALIEPSYGSFVTYRYNGEQLAISIESNHPEKTSEIYFDDGTNCKLPSRIHFTISTPENTEVNSTLLPIAGPGQIGTEPHKPTLRVHNDSGKVRRTPEYMLGGELRVYGRTAIPSERGTPYPTQSGKLHLPIGGRLVSSNDWQNSSHPNDAWYGVAKISDKALHISVTAESNELLFYRPGRSSDSEKFRVSVFNKLFDDPSVAPWSLLILFISISMQAFCGLISIWEKKNDIP